MKNLTLKPGRAAAVLASLALIGAIVTAPAAASATGPVTLEATFTSPSYGWSKVERWYDSNPGFIPAQYPSDGRLDQTGQRLTFFGAAKPNAGRFLLSYGPGWSTNPKTIPVLLVPGAYETADYAYANPSTSHPAHLGQHRRVADPDLAQLTPQV